jgi:hypothetical protein
MAFRGPALQYKIRKTTVNNSSGDNYSITIPRVIAQQFQEYWFKLSVSGNNLIFESGCKISVDDIEKQDKSKKVFVGGTEVIFK